MHPTAVNSDVTATFHPASSPDFLPRELLRRLQSQCLREMLGRAHAALPLLRQRMQKHGLALGDVRGVDDIVKLPLTTESDLRALYPWGMLAVPPDQVARLHVTGAAGQTIVAAYSHRDLSTWSQLAVRCLLSCGIRPGDLIQNACGNDVIQEALALDRAAEALGTTVIALPGGEADQQLAVLKDFGSSAICSAPSFFLHLVERAEKTGVDLRGLPLRTGIFVGEPWSESLRQRIEACAGIKAYEAYGSFAPFSLGVGAECCRQDGLHIFEDHFYPEIIDPVSGVPLADGQEGELVLTTLSQEAMPLIRYRTGQRTAMLAEPCPCSRTLRRIRRISRPSDEMLVLQGVHVFPSQIEAALLAVEGSLPHYQIVLTQQNGMEQIEVQIEVTPQVFSDRLGALENLQTKLAHEIERTLGISVPVRLVEPHTLQRRPDKDPRVVDRRGTLPLNPEP